MNQSGSHEVFELNPWERIRLTWRLLHDQRVPMWMKAAVPAIAMLYLVVPIDLIPDFILGLGQIDDASIIGVAIFAMTRLLPRMAPATLIDEHLDEMRGRSTGPAYTERETYVDASFRYADRPASDPQ